jgi:dTDP-4-dehydrorhamnose reductase
MSARNMDVSTRPRALVVGAAGRLGGIMVAKMAEQWSVRGLTRAELDLTDHDAVVRAVGDFAPSVVVNCAAYNHVDKAEDEVAQAFAVNAFGVDSLARAASATGATLVHYSTDFVFDGTNEGSYLESDRPQPRSVYGQSKLVGEWLAAEASGHYILRVASLFGGNASASIDRLIEQLRDGLPAPAFVDRTVTPSFVDDVADATMHLLQHQSQTGVYHAVASGATTWYDLALTIASRLGRPPAAVTPVKMADVALKAARPQYATLSNAKLAEAGFVMPTWQATLDTYLPRVVTSTGR